MENITLGQIGGTLAFIAAVITSLSVIVSFITKRVKKQVNETLTKAISEAVMPIKDEITSMKDSISDLTLDQCKNYLVRFVNDIKNGEPVSIGEIHRYYEVRDKYYGNGGNSYMHSECETIEATVRELMATMNKQR